MSLENRDLNSEVIQSGIAVLEKRIKWLNMWVLLSALVLILSLFSLYDAKSFVYDWFGLSTYLDQLHIPDSAVQDLSVLQQMPNYFLNVMAWLGWLCLKLTVAFFGAFLVIRWVKKFSFFQRRFQTFVLKVVTWVIAFILLWSGLSHIQQQRSDLDQNGYVNSIVYEQNIQTSEIAQHLKNSTLDPKIKAYVLAQVALLHQAHNQEAIPYVLELMQAEKVDPNFIYDGFHPAQLWLMQQQLYGKALTPMAIMVDEKAQKAEFVYRIVFYMFGVLAALSVLSLLASLLFANNIKKRVVRIDQKTVKELL